MTHGSLFSGVGGFDLAAEWMGWENLFHCEINEWCQKVLKYHFPNSIQYDDITRTDFTPWRGKVDVLTGGFPCQPFSTAGKRKGADDDRYLWPEMLRAIREIRPTWVIGENVAGILSMVQPGSEVTVESQASLFDKADKETILEQEYVIETVCRDLEREGYTVQPILIPARGVGAPHKRDRVWFIADRSDARIEGLRQNPQNPKGGRPKIEYRLSVPCMEFFIARKIRPVFEVYRKVFHTTVAKNASIPLESKKIQELKKDISMLENRLKWAKITSQQETDLKNSCFFYLVGKGLYTEWHEWNQERITKRITEEIKRSLNI